MKQAGMTGALIWKLCERFGVTGMQFVLQIILGRLLMPEDYGVMSMMIIFINLSNVFVQTGFNTSLIQRKDVSEEDYSSVFWLSMFTAIILYAVLFFLAPVIAFLCKDESVVLPFRILSLSVLPGALNSIQIAKVSRDLSFDKVFFCNIIATFFSGAIGVAIAINGGGLWAIVINNLLNVFLVCLVMLLVVKWKPRLVINFRRIKVLFSFGWKLLVSSFLDMAYQEIQSVVIGGRYDSTTLGYYSKGKHFPQFLINAITGAVQSVMLPVLSARQDDREEVKRIMRRSICMGAYIVFPMMAGLAACASPMIRLLLTDKWLPCVPYLQICCLPLAFYPVNACNLQAMNAMGRSDLFLKLELIKKSYGIVTLIFAVVCFDSPMAIAMTSAVTVFISLFVNAHPNKRLCGYSYFEQVKDLLPTFLLSIVMGGCVYLVQYAGLGNVVTLLIQVPLGIVIYILGSKLLHLESFEYIFSEVKVFFYKRKNCL